MQRVAIAPQQRQEDAIFLTPEQQHYLYRVLRLAAGDRFLAMDGCGKTWIAQLEDTTAKIIDRLEVKTELPVAVTLGIALPKGNAFDDLVRCCTELGAAAIVPLLSDRVLLNPSPQKLERWRRIIREAGEQSERQILPTLSAPVRFNPDWLQSCAPVAGRYLCVARGEFPHLLTCLQSSLRLGEVEEIAIATGPEGGWTVAEVESAIAAGFQPVSLGKRILRAATAPIVALSILAAAIE
ncbi:16S rRNA (uracil(1498)-N(3))-methyltransferase [Oscillatoria sp. FACHB-1406]|uniref:16S rRNA (uracil(1498)-N(3))-methyltransferase n=1 Tax=Oscillatoria sp. FACHB-1406 TaxID=2692846 RepID=UPI001688C907|nr:16S rRNA (uracil(1498)-N(3))-methyltransferase [Oscillatoria sp. FACHB-1406]MBD2579914.1 16S rRNA (uracil(1498)-N(3))-methyltransferase [Oscillatoria sp. FACHB-1406]